MPVLLVSFLTIEFILPIIDAVNYEVRLDDGKVVAKSDGVEFTVSEGQSVPVNFDNRHFCIFMLVSEIYV